MAYQANDDELRMLSVAAPVLLRMLAAREEIILQRMYGEFRSGALEHTARIAEFACVRDLTREIKTALAVRDKGEK
jgi:hypothetical protein